MLSTQEGRGASSAAQISRRPAGLSVLATSSLKSMRLFGNIALSVLARVPHSLFIRARTDDHWKSNVADNGDCTREVAA